MRNIFYNSKLNNVAPFIEFNITQKCNYKCEYCTQWQLNKDKPEQLFNASDDVIDGFIDLLRQVGKEFDVNLIGGEPFCHPKLIETARRISELGNKIIIYTNMAFPVSIFEKLIKATGNNLKLIHGALHVGQVKDLDKTIDNIIAINNMLNNNSKLRIVSVLTEENFETLKYAEKRLNRGGVEFIYIRLVQKNGVISKYSKSIEEYLKPREHKYNRDMLNARKINTKKVLCYAGYKLFHVWTDGTIVRCWSKQTKDEYQFFGNVKYKNSIKLFDRPEPCYSPICYCQHPTARNAYFYSCLTSFYRKEYQNIFSIKNEYLNNKKYKVVTIFGIKIKFG